MVIERTVMINVVIGLNFRIAKDHIFMLVFNTRPALIFGISH